MYLAASNPKVKIATYPISIGDDFKKRYFRVYDGKIWYDYGFRAAEFNNKARLVILVKVRNITSKELFEKQFVGQHRIFMDFDALNSVFKSDQHNNKQTSDVNFKIKRDNVSSIERLSSPNFPMLNRKKEYSMDLKFEAIERRRFCY